MLMDLLLNVYSQVIILSLTSELRVVIKYVHPRPSIKPTRSVQYGCIERMAKAVPLHVKKTLGRRGGIAHTHYRPRL
jgi:hypothetical protein